MTKRDILYPDTNWIRDINERCGREMVETPIPIRSVLSRLELNRDQIMIISPRLPITEMITNNTRAITAYLRKTREGYLTRELYPGETFTDHNGHPIRYTGQGFVP